MAYIPKNAEWFVAELVFAIDVEDDPRSVTHINTVLVRASEPNDAYAAAIQLGRDAEYRDVNPFGKTVTTGFLGIRELNVVHGKLEHGAELWFDERIGLTREERDRLVTPKGSLAVFAPVVRGDKPDYSSDEIVRKAIALMARKKSSDGEA